MDNQIEIPSSIIINKCSAELKNEILKYAGENSIKIDKLCLMMDGIMADLHRMRADYYAQTMADIVETLQQSNKVGGEINEFNQSVQQDNVGELSE